MKAKRLNNYERIYQFLLSGSGLWIDLEKQLRAMGVSNIERSHLISLKTFRDNIHLLGDVDAINLILNRSMEVIPKEKLLLYSAVAVDNNSQIKLVHTTQVYHFIPTMVYVNEMISLGLYPQSVWIDKVKHKNPPLEPEEKKLWYEKKNAQRFQSLSFIDFATLCTVGVNQTFVDLFNLTGLLPRIDLSTAHDGKHSLRMTLSLIDVLVGGDGVVMAYPPDSMFGVRIVHTHKLATHELIVDAIRKMSENYEKIVHLISKMKNIKLTDSSARILSEKIMSTILFKRVWERGIIECRFQEEMNSILIGKNVWDALLFIQDKLYHKDGIAYVMETSKGPMSKTKKFNLDRLIQKKVIFGAVFTACYDIILSKD